MQDWSPNTTRRNLFGLFFLLLFTFMYFKQGGGFNQNSTIGEIREFVEHGKFTINNWTPVTGDVSELDGKIYSNKPPSMLFVTAPFYFLMDRLATAFGVNKSGSKYHLNVNSFITFFCANVWGALLGIMIFLVTKEFFPNARNRDLFGFALIACLGSMIFPYSTVAFVHVFECFWVFFSLFWSLRSFKDPSPRNLAWFGIGFGFMLTSNPILVLSAPVVYLAMFIRRIRLSQIMRWSLCVVIPMIPLLIYNQINFGFFLSSNRTHLKGFTDPNLFMGVFAVPDFKRLWEIYGYGHRSLFPAQIPALLGIFGFFYLLRSRKLAVSQTWFILALFAIYNLIILTFNGWHGGSCYGPRYFLPAAILMYLFSFPIYQNFPKIFSMLGVFSFTIFLMVTSVQMFPGESDFYPLTGSVIPNFLAGNLRQNNYPIYPGLSDVAVKYNIGHSLGLAGYWSILPLLLIIGFALTKWFGFYKPFSETRHKNGL